MSQHDLESFDHESERSHDSSVYTRFPVSKLPGRGAVMVLLGSGSLLAGMGLLQSFYLSGAFGQGSAVGSLALRSSELGWSPSVLTLGGLVMIGLGSVARSLLSIGRNLLGEIVDLPDPSASLEDLDVQQQKLHVNMVSVQGAVERAVQTSHKALRDQLLGIEGRIYNVEAGMGSGASGEQQEREEALRRFTTSLESFSGRIENRIEQRMELFEQGLAEELAEMASSLAETLLGQQREAQATQQAEQERARATREAADRARREAEVRSAPAAPKLPELDSLGVFDKLDDEGRPVDAPPAQSAPPAAALPQPAPGPQAGLPPQPTAPPQYGPGPGVEAQQASGYPPPASDPGHASQHAGTPAPPAALPQTAPQPAAPAAAAGLPPMPSGLHAGASPAAAHPAHPEHAAPGLHETAIRHELRLVDDQPAPGPHPEPGAALPQSGPAGEASRRLEPFDPYGDYDPNPRGSGGPGSNPL